MSLCRRAISGALLFAALATLSVQAQDADPELARFKAMSESDTMIMVPMRDGVRLATDVHLPKGDGPFPVILVKTPYNFNMMGGSTLMFANEAIERGYAVVVQNERGRYYSEGEWEILGATTPRASGRSSASRAAMATTR
jgi:predicted acyl esterase